MKNFYRIMRGKRSVHAQTCRQGNFIGADFGIDQDLTDKLPEHRKDFGRVFVPIMREKFPRKTKIGIGLACGFLYTVAKGLKSGDIVLCPDGSGLYHVGEVVSKYAYHPGEILPHRRNVRWYDQMIERSEMSTALKHSTGSIGTVSEITKFAEEVEWLIAGKPPIVTSDDETDDYATVFALEKHLEDFLVQNWGQTELGKRYEIVQEDGELVGQQYPTDTGPIDILAVRKDDKELLVVELKRAKASDRVVGQIQRYMGYVLEELAEPGQKVRGVIIALEDDLRIRRALTVTSNIEFYRYEVTFKLFRRT